MNLHDWIDEVCDALDLDTEVDEALVLDLARVAAHNVERPAAPITAYLLGYAAGADDADPDAIERMVGRLAALAESWDRPAGADDEPDAEADAVADAADSSEGVPADLLDDEAAEDEDDDELAEELEDA